MSYTSDSTSISGIVNRQTNNIARMGVAVDLGFGDRMRGARMAVAAKRGKTVSQGAMAQLITEELARLGSGKTVSQSAWSAYESETSEPSLLIFKATSNVSGLAESFLAFGVDFDEFLKGSPSDDQVDARREARIEPAPIPAPRGKSHEEAVNEFEKSNEKKSKPA